MDCMDLSLSFANTAELDLQNYLCFLTPEYFSLGPSGWIVDTGGYGWLFVLAGVGGAGIYLVSCRGEERGSKYQQWREKFTTPQWIFQYQSEENSDPFFSVLLRSFNLGILSPHSKRVRKPAVYCDLSLNTLDQTPAVQKFLRQPIDRRHLLQTEYKDKKCNENNVIRTKRIPFNKRMKQSKDKMILQRVVASNRMSFKFYQPGIDLRMEGDGCENPAEFSENMRDTINTDNNDKYYQKDKCNSCTDPHCNSAYCQQNDTEIEENKNWMEFMQNAEELRRFIRETSFDSLASDISFGINLVESDDIDFSFDNQTDSSFDSAEERFYPRQLISDSNVWKLTEIADDDNRSFVGSTLDNWEWDEECYYGEDDNQLEQNTEHQSWLPDSCTELDLETELCSADSDQSARCSPVEGRVTPLGDECKTVIEEDIKSPGYTYASN